MEQKIDSNKVRCVKGDKVAYFNRKTASKPSWQRSTGWTIQELPAELTGNQEGSRQPETEIYAVNKAFELLTPELASKAKKKDILLKGSKEECEKYITENKI